MSEGEITVTVQKRVIAGSCNGCQRRDDEKVYLVDLKTCSIRLCDKCAADLQRKLAEFTGSN